MNDVPKALLILRGIDRNFYWQARPVPSKQPFRFEAIFTNRTVANATHAEWEREAAAKGNPGPLLDLQSLDELIRLSDFEPGIFRDYLLDHDIPNPETFEPTRRVTDGMGLANWLMDLSPVQLGALYAGLHKFRFYELIEVPFVFGEYGQEQWEEWEKELPTEIPPDEEDSGWREVEGGFEAVPGGTPPAGWYEQQQGTFDANDPVTPTGSFPPTTAGWDQDIPIEGEPPPPFGEDDIPF